jgi:hypothetical protein
VKPLFLSCALKLKSSGNKKQSKAAFLIKRFEDTAAFQRVFEAARFCC